MDLNQIMEKAISHNTKQRLAESYLFTIGAKALVLADKGQEREVILHSLDEEKDAKNEMLLEESTKAFKRCMNVSPGILVQKRARNGSTRDVYIRYHKEHKELSAAGFGIAWQSNLGFTKSFDLSMVQAVDVTNGGAHDGFIRLENPTRHLELKFAPAVRAAFLHHMASLAHK